MATAAIPSNWQAFLREDTNQTELFSFLSASVMEWFDQEDKKLAITERDNVCTRPLLNDMANLIPCSHEEADTRMLLHMVDANQMGHKKILIRTVDTDVVVLAVSMARTIHEENELWIAFGNGNGCRYLAAHQIAKGLGPEKAQALPMFHSLTGCATTSSFAGHGKKSAWSV